MNTHVNLYRCACIGGRLLLLVVNQGAHYEQTISISTTCSTTETHSTTYLLRVVLCHAHHNSCIHQAPKMIASSTNKDILWIILSMKKDPPKSSASWYMRGTSFSLMYKKRLDLLVVYAHILFFLFCLII